MFISSFILIIIFMKGINSLFNICSGLILDKNTWNNIRKRGEKEIKNQLSESIIENIL